MIDTYTESKKIVATYWMAVAYRYVSQEPEGVNHIFTPEELMQAFEYEGFSPRPDFLWGITVKFLSIIKYPDGTLPKTIKIVNEEELRDLKSSVGVPDDAYFPPACRLTTEGVEKAEKQLMEIYGDNILSDKPLAEQLGLVEEGTAPAADRIVKLDDNSVPLDHDDPKHQATIKQLGELAEELRKVNEPPAKKAIKYVNMAKDLLEEPELRKTDWQTIKGWFGWIEKVITFVGRALELFDSVSAHIKGFFQ